MIGRLAILILSVFTIIMIKKTWKRKSGHYRLKAGRLFVLNIWPVPGTAGFKRTYRYSRSIKLAPSTGDLSAARRTRFINGVNRCRTGQNLKSGFTMYTEETDPPSMKKKLSLLNKSQKRIE